MKNDSANKSSTNNIFFGIPTIIKRWDYAKELSEQIGVDKEHIFLDSHRNGCLWNKMRIHDYAKQHGYSHVCINDDDTICCRNYRQLVQRCVDKFPDAILTFFSNKMANSKAPFVKRINCQLAGAAFVLPTKMVDAYKKFYADHLSKYKFEWEDTTTKMFALMNDIDVILVMPNPVTVREGLITSARKGKWSCAQSLSFVSDFPEHVLDTNSIEVNASGGLFNLHLPKGCDTAVMIQAKWEEVKKKYQIGGRAQ